MSAITEPSTPREQSTCSKIGFEITSNADRELSRVPMTSGLCVPKGELFEAGDWVVDCAGAKTAAQVDVLNRWSDGSVRWLLTRFVANKVSPGTTSCAMIRPERRPTLLSGSATLRQEGDAIRITLRDLHQIGRTLLLRPEIRLKDVQGRSNPVCQELQFESVKTESSGDVCHTFVVDAHLKDASFVKLQLRLEVWPTAGHVRADVRLRNARRAHHTGGLWDLGDAGSFLFDSLVLHAEERESTESCGDIQGRVSFRPEAGQAIRSTERLHLQQNGSGGPNWASPVHIDANGQQTVFDRGYTCESDAGSTRGHRAQPVVALQTSEQCLTVAIADFWQNFPTSVSADCTADTAGLQAGLFPSTKTPHELQGGEQKTSTVWFSTRCDDDLHQLDWVPQTPRILQSAASISAARVLPWFPGTATFATEATSRYAAYITDATADEHSFAARRDKVDEYGWRNFGDIHADHEQTHFAGDATVISHYNNQFDLIFGGIQNAWASGEAEWFDFFDAYARHVMDVDIYHTTEDRSCFNGGLFWHTDHYADAATATHRTYSKTNAEGRPIYGGGPSSEHNYSTGLLYYHFLTGSRDAADSVVSLADWVINMDDGSRTVFSVFDDGPTGLASATAFEDFHGPGRGVGNSINALLDAWILTGNDRYQQKCDELIRRCVSPNQDCTELHLLDAEGHWSYTVCLTALGRYLIHKQELGQRDSMYDYVRQTMAHYGRWMAKHERPTLSEPEKVAFVTETWAAQDFRKANVLRIAATCCDDDADKATLRAKADELNDASWKYLHDFGNKHLTARCLSILMTEGLRDVFHRECEPETLAAADEKCEPAEWTMFVPQKIRVKRMLKNPLKLIKAASGLLNPRRWKESLAAYRRR